MNNKIVYGGVALAFLLLAIVLSISWATRENVSKSWLVAAVVSLVIGIVSFALYMTTSDDDEEEPESQAKEKNSLKQETTPKSKKLYPREPENG